MKMDKIDSKLLSQQYFSVKSSINSLLIIFAYSIASKISLPSNQNVSNKYFQSSTRITILSQSKMQRKLLNRIPRTNYSQLYAEVQSPPPKYCFQAIISA